MDTETGEMIIKRVSVPIGLEELMEGLVKEVLLKKPDDIYVFAARYFTHLLTIREKVPHNKVKTLRSIHTLKDKVDNTATHAKTSKLSKQFSIREDSSVPNLDSPIISQKPKMYNRNELKHNKRRHTGPSTVLPNNQQLTIRRKYARSVSGDKQESNNNKNKVYTKKQQADISSEKATKSRKERNNNNTKLPILAENNSTTKTIEDNNNSIDMNNTETELLIKDDIEKIQNIELVTESGKTVDNNENKIPKQTDDKSESTAIKLENILTDKIETSSTKTKRDSFILTSSRTIDDEEVSKVLLLASKSNIENDKKPDKLEMEIPKEEALTIENEEETITLKRTISDDSLELNEEDKENDTTNIKNEIGKKIADENIENKKDKIEIKETIEINSDNINENNKIVKEVINDENVIINVQKTDLEAITEGKNIDLNQNVLKTTDSDSKIKTVLKDTNLNTNEENIDENNTKTNTEKCKNDQKNITGSEKINEQEKTNIDDSKKFKEVPKDNENLNTNDSTKTFEKMLTIDTGDLNKNKINSTDKKIERTLTIDIGALNNDTITATEIFTKKEDGNVAKNINFDVLKTIESASKIKTVLKETNLNIAEDNIDETLKNNTKTNTENCKNDQKNITDSEKINEQEKTDVDDSKKFKEVPKDNECLNENNCTKTFEKMLTIDAGDLNKNKINSTDKKIEKKLTIDIGDLNNETITVTDIFTKKEEENVAKNINSNVSKTIESASKINTVLKETNLNTAEDETLKNNTKTNTENCKNDQKNITGSEKINEQEKTDVDDSKKFKEVPKNNETLNKNNSIKTFEKMLTIDAGDLNKNKINSTDKKIEKKLTIEIGDLNDKTITATEIFTKKEEENVAKNINSDNKEKTNNVKEILTQKNEVLPLENKVIEELIIKDINNKLEQNNDYKTISINLQTIDGVDNSNENTKTANLPSKKDNNIKVEILNDITNNETNIVEEISVSSKNDIESLTNDPNKIGSEEKVLTKQKEETKNFQTEISNNEDKQNNNEKSIIGDKTINDNVSEDYNNDSNDNSTNKNSVDISNNSNESSTENNLVDRVAKNYVTYVIDNDRYLFDENDTSEPDLNQTELKSDDLPSISPDKIQSLDSEDEDLEIIQNKQITDRNKEDIDKNNTEHLINSTLSIAKTGLIENKVKTFLNEFIEGEKTFRSLENAADLTKIKNGLKKTTSFDSSKLRDELKQVEEESKFTSFKTSYNPFLLRKEIQEAKPDEGSVLTSLNFRKVVDAVVTIQNGWIRYKKRKNINKIQESKHISGSRQKKEINNQNVDFLETAQAAVMIQKLWRGFRARKSINVLLAQSNSAKKLTIAESNLTKNIEKDDEKLLESKLNDDKTQMIEKETENSDQTDKRIFSAESTDSVKTVIFNDTKPDFHNEHYSSDVGLVLDEILDYPTIEEEHLLDNYQSKLLDKISGKEENNKFDDFHEFEKIISPKSIDLEQLKDEVHVPLLPKNNLNIATGERKLTKSSKLEILTEEEENKTDKKDVDITVTNSVLDNKSNALTIKEENISDKEETEEKMKSDNKDSINTLDIKNVKVPLTEEEIKINKKEVVLKDSSVMQNNEENKNVALIPENKDLLVQKQEASTVEEKNCNKKDDAPIIENKESKNILSTQIREEENKLNKKEVALIIENKSVIKNVALIPENKDLLVQKQEALTVKAENSNKKEVDSIIDNKDSENKLDVQNVETPIMEEENKITNSNVFQNKEENKSITLIPENKDSDNNLVVQNMAAPIMEEENKIIKREVALTDLVNKSGIQNDKENVALIAENKDLPIQKQEVSTVEEGKMDNKKYVDSIIKNKDSEDNLKVQSVAASTSEKEYKNVNLTPQNKDEKALKSEVENSDNKNLTIKADIKESGVKNKADLTENKNVIPTNENNNLENKLGIQSVSVLSKPDNKSDNANIGLTAKNKDSENNLDVQNVAASTKEKENKFVKNDVTLKAQTIESGVQNGNKLESKEENISDNKNITLTEDIKESSVQNKAALTPESNKNDVIPINKNNDSENKSDIKNVSVLSKPENKRDNENVNLTAKNKYSENNLNTQNVATSTTEKENNIVKKNVTLKPQNIDSGVQNGKELINNNDNKNTTLTAVANNKNDGISTSESNDSKNKLDINVSVLSKPENKSDNADVGLTAENKEFQNKEPLILEEDNKKNMAIPIKNKDTDVQNEETLYTFCSEPTPVPCENKPLSEHVETNKPLQSGVHETLVIPLPTEVKNKLNTDEIEGKSNEINDLDRFSSILSNAGINSGDLHDTVVVPVNEQNVDTGRSQPISVQLCQTSGQVFLIIVLPPFKSGYNQDAENLMTSTDVTGIAAANDGGNAHDPGKVDLQVESRFENGARSISCPESMQSEKRRKIDSVNMETQAATKIQAGFRGYQVRKQLKSKNGSSDMPTSKKITRSKSAGGVDVPKNQSKKSGEVEEQSAVKIQAGIRGFLVRRRQKKHSSQQA